MPHFPLIIILALITTTQTLTTYSVIFNTLTTPTPSPLPYYTLGNIPSGYSVAITVSIPGFTSTATYNVDSFTNLDLLDLPTLTPVTGCTTIYPTSGILSAKTITCPITVTQQYVVRAVTTPAPANTAGTSPAAIAF